MESAGLAVLRLGRLAKECRLNRTVGPDALERAEKAPNRRPTSAMKRQRRKAKGNKGRNAAVTPGAEKPQGGQTTRSPSSRRDFFKKVGSRAAVAVAAGGLGWYLIEEVWASIREDDLTRIGNGIPTVVQIHDPQCPTCRALQREVRKALVAFDDEELQYVVANIRTAKGSRLANAHRVGHITVLLFDGEGRMRDTLVGPSTSDLLEHAFRRHVERKGS